MIIEHEFEIDNFLDVYRAKLWIEVECIPGDPGVRYDQNGTGTPPSPPEVDVIKARVLCIEFIGREDLERLGAYKHCDEQAACVAQDMIDRGSWLLDDIRQLLEALTEES